MVIFKKLFCAFLIYRADLACRVPRHNCASLNIFCNHTSSRNHSIPANIYTFKNDRAGAHPNIIFKMNRRGLSQFITLFGSDPMKIGILA